MKSVVSRRLLIFSLLISSALFMASLYQNCSGKDHLGRAIIGSSNQASSVAPPPEDLDDQPSPFGVLDSSCASNPDYDTCLFYKNPVAQTGAPFPTQLAYRNPAADNRQIYGVKLNRLANPHVLANSTINVISSFGSPQRATEGPNGWKHAYSQASNNEVAHLMAYYWLTTQETEIHLRTGKFYASGRNIRVEPHHTGVCNNAYWDGRDQIVMGVAGSFTQGTCEPATSHEMAMSAEVYLHEMGHANLTFATLGTYGNVPPEETTAVCDLGNNNLVYCCANSNGCSGAIHEAIADYQAGMIFQDAPALGETWVNNLSGFSSCGLQRNPAAHPNITSAQAYNACVIPGLVHAHGVAYSSAWWEVRTGAGVNVTEVDQVFVEHLAQLTVDDSFVTALDKILLTDQIFFAGKYSAAFTSAFQRIGINPSQ